MKQKSRIRKILMLLVLSFMMVGVWPAREAQAATDEAKAKVRETIIEVFRTGDTSTKNIHDLKLTWEEFDAIYNEVVENECWLEYRCCYNTIYQTTTYKENRIKYVTDFYMWGMDSRLPEHTAAVKEKIAYIQSQIDSKMTDLDKLVLIHDYIDRITTYDLNAEHGYIHSAVGPLCYGSSVCDGYAKAMNLLLNVVGIETDTVSNDGHEWSLVKIDGEYYHVDPTWDDTRCYKTGTYKTHYFMMRNDDEYRNDPYSPHTGFGYYDYVNNVDVTTFSTSTKYTDWYVHSVIGDMYYYDGYWYYVQDGSIVKNKISKTADTCETVVNGTGITLVGITDGVLSYKENSVEKTISLSTDAESGSETEGNIDAEGEITLEEAKEEFRKILIGMIETGDGSKRDVSHLKLTYSDYYPIFQDVIENECKIAYSCYYNAVPQTEKDSDGYVSKFWFYYVDPDFQTQYGAVKEKIAYINNQLDPDMTDLDKLLWIHDYMISITQYKDSGYGHQSTSVGVLYNGEAVCTGYARALAALLHSQGIKSYQVKGDNHEWLVVLIDGELYHVDPTWDDTRCNKEGVSGKHYFLMRTDSEFMDDSVSPHQPQSSNFQLWDSDTKQIADTNCTSTKYTDWYVHSVSGDMYYYDGYWYYVQDGNIMKNNIQGTDCATVASGTDITLQGITEGVLIYTVDAEEKVLQLSGNDESENGGSEDNGSEESGTEDNKDSESGDTTGGSEENGGEESGTEDNKDSESGDTTGGNKDSGNNDVISQNTIGGNAGTGSENTIENGNITEKGNTTENGNKNATETGNADGYEMGDTNNTQLVFKDKKSKGYYQVLTKGKKTGTVVYVKPYASAKGKVTIPATVKKDGITYKVIGICANAFKNNKKITQIVIGKNVKTIGAKAFYNCKKLKTIKINTTKLTSSSVKKTAFKGISKKVTVKVAKSKYSKYKKLLASKGLKSKSQVQKK